MNVIETMIVALPSAYPHVAKEEQEPLHVDDSSFESWFQKQPFATHGVKQIARDAYAAGMGDPLVCARTEIQSIKLD